MRKLRLRSRKRRPHQVGRHIQAAVRAFSEGKLLPRVDVLALQEADKQTSRTGGHHVARELAEGLGMSWVHVPAGIPRGEEPKRREWWLDFEEPIDLFDPGDTGVAMLSGLQLTDVERIDLPWDKCAWRPRLAMAATVAVGQQKLRVINAHIDPHAHLGGHLEQLEVLVERARNFARPTLVLGDFNTLSKQKVNETYAFMESHGYSTPFPKRIVTWRGAGLRMAADWIFYRDVKVSRWGVARPLNVSDHWPVWAEVAFPSTAG
jgi:endonuclease/exonuclease/phosphatase family metal-dependent hydrolase